MNRFLIFLSFILVLIFLVIVSNSSATSDDKRTWCFCEIENNPNRPSTLKHSDENYQSIRCESDSGDFVLGEPKDFKYTMNNKVFNCFDIPMKSSLDNVTSIKIKDLRSTEILFLKQNILPRLQNIREVFFSGWNFQVDSYCMKFVENNTKIEVLRLHGVEYKTDFYFYFLKNLTDLDLFHIYIWNNIPFGFFFDNTHLKKLNLTASFLRKINNDVFENCQELEVIDLQSSQITTLEKKNSFAYSKELVAIYLQHNKIEFLEKSNFKNLYKLKILHLSYNNIFELDCDVFEDLIQLTELYLDNNNLHSIEYCHMRNLVSLKIATFSHNKFTVNSKENLHSSTPPFYNNISVEKLYFENNQLSGFCFSWNQSRIDRKPIELYFSHNKFKLLSDVQFHFEINRKIILNVSHNEITSLFFNNQPELTYYGSRKSNQIEVYANDNPLNCDCSLHALIGRANKTVHTVKFDNWTTHIDNLKCNEPSWLKNTPIETFESETYRFQLNDLNMNKAKCPDNCSCWRRPSDNSSTIIDCSSRNLTSGPNSIQLLFGYQIQLNLSNNLLSSMPLTSQTAGYELVTILDLSHNNITYLTRKGLPIKLEILYMHNNRLVKIETNVLHYLRHDLLNFKKLTLHDNSFECNCDLKELSYDLQNNKWSQSEKAKITCGSSNRQVYKLSKQDLCPLNYYLAITICIVLAFVAIVTCIVIIFYLYEVRIKIWLYEKQWLSFWVTGEELDNDKCFDAFISYSHKDHDFVINNLVRELEKGPQPFKLCIHYRDWLAGESILNQIKKSIINSKRTIVVLSSNFLESPWTHVEFRAAHRLALKDRRNRVIVVMIGELPPIENFNEELQSYLRMYSYLEWKDPFFWPKLRFAMPHKNRKQQLQIDTAV